MVLNNKKKNDLNTYYPLIFIFLFIFLISQYSFSYLEAFFYDLRVKYDLWSTSKLNITLIKMSEESDLYLGEKSPYSYSTHNVFFQNLLKGEPRAVIFLSSLESALDEKENLKMEELKKSIKQYIKGGGIFRFGTKLDVWGETLPPAMFREFGHSLTLINTDSATFSKDDVCRKAILNVSGEDSLHLWLVKKLKNEEQENFFGEFYSSEADATFTHFRYNLNPNIFENNLKIIPYHQVVTNNFSKDYFKGKIVLIGDQYEENSNDFVLVPFNKTEKPLTPKLNLHAVILEALYQGKTVYQLPNSVMTVLCLILAVFLSMINFRLSPAQGIILILVGIVLSLLISFILFNFGIWIHSVKLMLTFFVVYYIWIPYRAIAEYQIRFAMEKETKLFKEVDHLKRNFLSLMSHDLKTPVAKIIGKVDNLLNFQNLDPLVKKYLLEVKTTTNDLNHFITKILDLTKAESQNFNISKVSRDINKIILEVVEKCQNDAREKGSQIKTDLYPLFPINIDPELMKRVISNLVENAVKYSGLNKTISVSTWDDDDFVYVKVADDGEGIPKDELPRIFEKFYRVKGNSDEIKGTGLGLYLVKYFVELHGGKIEVVSELNNGTTFLIQLKNN